MSAQVEVRLPELADAMASATLAAWLKKPGDTVTAGEPIAEVETDKTTVELEAPADGVLDIRVAAGTRDVKIGALLAVVREGARAGEKGPTADSAPPLIEVRLPELADAMTSATLTAWLKEPGDTVTAGEPIAEVETDKTTVELEAPAGGVLAEIRVAAGAEAVAVGTVLALVRSAMPSEAPPQGAPAASPALPMAETSVPAATSPVDTDETAPWSGARGRDGRNRYGPFLRSNSARSRGPAGHAAGAADGRARWARPPQIDRFRGRRPRDEGGRGAPAPVSARGRRSAGCGRRTGIRAGRLRRAGRDAGVGPSLIRIGR